ncbi:hypothetical protein Y032_0118g765 [Ancylostoma ceylanicum]|uniref:Uncharacterized protein n=1 Tax=Ancylostoma ceylanicum TaxID=53326 RepID=A0A016TBM8_9BILA|nr:hypothetical protein Y032_0118g765 [Ancylostoma ceylanicum]
MHILFNSCYDRGTIILITNTKLSPIYLISNADKTTALDGTVAFLMSSWLPNCNQLSGQKNLVAHVLPILKRVTKQYIEECKAWATEKHQSDCERPPAMVMRSKICCEYADVYPSESLHIEVFEGKSDTTRLTEAGCVKTNEIGIRTQVCYYIHDQPLQKPCSHHFRLIREKCQT